MAATGEPSAPTRRYKRPITVSVDALPTYDIYTKVSNDIAAQLPLPSIHWKPLGRPLRSINGLEVELRPFSHHDTRPQSQMPLTLLERPNLHLLFVSCDDVEHFRNDLKHSIQSWLNAVRSRKNQEWLIVHLSSAASTTSNQSSKFYRKGSVIDRIRADFNTDKRDRCVSLSYTSAQDRTAFAEFINKLKDGFVASFDANVLTYEEDIRKLDNQRQLPGWNYCTFFIQKEALARTFEAVDLLEDALLQYDELEASFFQVIKDRNMPWIANFGAQTPGDDSLPLLPTPDPLQKQQQQQEDQGFSSSEIKDYRNMILSNSISLFDFRCYLFSRQATLLGQARLLDQVTHRALIFISNFSLSLKEHSSALGKGFIESWIYSTCINVVNQCYDWAAQFSIDPLDIPGFTAHSAELLELALYQVEVLGSYSGFTPPSTIFCHPQNNKHQEEHNGNKEEEDDDEHFRISNRDLLTALKNSESWDELYIPLAERVLTLFNSCARRRSSFRIKACLACLDQHRNNSESAQQLLHNLSNPLTTKQWNTLDQWTWSNVIAVDSQRGPLYSHQHLKTLIKLLRSQTLFDHPSSPRKQGIWQTKLDQEKASHLWEKLKWVSAQLNGDNMIMSPPAFEAYSLQFGSHALNEDASMIDLVIWNGLTCKIDLDDVRLRIVREGLSVWMTSEQVELQPGKNIVSVSCHSSLTGYFEVDVIQLVCRKLIMQLSPHTSQHKNYWEPPPSLIQFPIDNSALDIELEPPHTITIGKPQYVILKICSERNDISVAYLDVRPRSNSSSPSSSPAFSITSAQKIDNEENELDLKMTEFGFQLDNIAPNTITLIKINLDDLKNETNVLLCVRIKYETTINNEKVQHALRCLRKVTLGIPVSATVQDFFRPGYILSKFTVTSDSKIHTMRLKNVELNGPENLTITSPPSKNSSEYLLKTGKAANFLFTLTKKDHDKLQDPDQLMNLTIYYLMQDEEINDRIKLFLTKFLKQNNSKFSYRHFIRQATDQLTNICLSNKSFSWNSVKDLMINQVVKECSRDDDEYQLLEKVLQQVVDKVSNNSPQTVSEHEPESEPNWRKLIIPIEIPAITVMSTIAWNIPLLQEKDSSKKIYIGDTLDATLCIKTSFEWARKTDLDMLQGIYSSLKNKDVINKNDEKEVKQDGSGSGSDVEGSRDQIEMLFDVQADMSNWLIVGVKKGQFTAYDQTETKLELKIMPTCRGTLYLPPVSVLPLLPPEHITGTSCDSYQSTGAKTVEVLPTESNASWDINLGI